MSGTSTDVERLFGLFVERHVLHGERLALTDLCRDRTDLRVPLQTLIDNYLSLTASFDEDPLAAIDDDAGLPAALPHFEGFETIERLGAGGMGEVFKLKDLRLGRIVAGKILRGERGASVDAFLREARSLALFSDRRIVQIFECRPDADPPFIIMEYVDGFELGRLGPSLEFAQRARIMAEICDVLHRAHAMGLQHRDLKPSNVMLDADLAPRILDFGLAEGHPRRGHLRGTLPDVAPEQLDPSQPIDARTDVYALGVTFYELLSGALPYGGAGDQAITDAIRLGHPRLPVEIDPRVPEPLQAIALKAMERDPAQRYQTTLDMAGDLRRFISGRPVTARPSLYTRTLGDRVGPHVQQIGEWLQLRLIYPHEAQRLRAAYRTLEVREEDWILASRALSYSQIALYLGAFLLVCGSLFYFAADRWYHAVEGIVRPLAVLGAPFIGLNAAAHLLYRRDHKAVAIAFYLAAVALLPLLLLILFHEAGLFVVSPETAGQLFQDGSVSNRQLQITTFAACLWCAWLALSTRTAALSTVFTVLVLLCGLSVLADFGLRSWIVDARWDLLSLHVLPLVLGYALIGDAAERTGRPWLGSPSYVAGVLLFMVALELLALDGRELAYLGISLRPYQGPGVSDPLLLDTLSAMTLNGLAFYVLAVTLDRYGTELQAVAAWVLFAVAPFALLQPLGYLVRSGEYSQRFDWIYLGSAIGIALAAETRQRRTFYYAGLLNTGAALFLIADHRHWYDRPGWAMTVIAAGLIVLMLGFILDRRSRTR
jgi:hypothetical protein